MKSLIVLMVLFSFVSSPALSEVYRYTDSQGQLHFVDDIARVPKKYRKQLENPKPMAEISVMDATPVAARRKREKEVPQQAKPAVASGVEVFVTSSCGYCRKMLRFLNEKGIPYTARDINNDTEAARAFGQLGAGACRS